MGKHLCFYYNCLSLGRLPAPGLDNCPEIDEELYTLFTPSVQDRNSLIKEGLPIGYWDCGIHFSDLDNIDKMLSVSHTFSSLRQTIVLFMAAMNGEL